MGSLVQYHIRMSSTHQHGIGKLPGHSHQESPSQHTESHPEYHNHVQSFSSKTHDPRLISSLSSFLAQQSDEFLHTLLQLRPDVLAFQLRSTHSLASHLLSPSSVHEALMHLPSTHLHFLHASSAVPSSDSSMIQEMKDELRQKALAWPTDDANPDSLETLPFSRYLEQLPYRDNFLRMLSLSPPAPCNSSLSDTLVPIVELLYDCELIITTIKENPLPLTNKNNVGVREWKKLAHVVNRNVQDTGWMIALLKYIHILTFSLDNQDHPQLLVVDDTYYHEWQSYEFSQKWATLVTAALDEHVCWWKIGTQSPGKPLIGPLSTLIHTPDPRLTLVLESLLSAAHYKPLPDPIDNVLWWRPYILTGAHPSSISMMLKFLTFLGIAVDNCVSNFGSLLSTQSSNNNLLAERAAALMPQAVDQVVVQSNGSLIVTGIPSAQLLRTLQSMARYESGGMGASYRICEEKIKQSLKSNICADHLINALQEITPTDIPSPVITLMRDAERTINRIHIGNAHSYIHCSDASDLSRLLHHRDISMHVHQLSATIAVSSLPTELLSHVLHMHDIDSLTLTHTASSRHSPDSDFRSSSLSEENILNDSGGRSPEHSALHESDERASHLTSDQAISHRIVTIREGDVLLNSKTIEGTVLKLDGTKLSLHAAMKSINDAIADEQLLKIKHITFNGAQHEDILLPLSLSHGRLMYKNQHTQQTQDLPIHRILQLERITL